MFYDDDLGTENIFSPVYLITEYASVTINVYIYSIHLGIWNVTAVFQFPVKAGSACWMVRPRSDNRKRRIIDASMKPMISVKLSTFELFYE